VAFSGWWYERGESSAVVPLAWRVEEPVSATAYEKQRIPDNVLIALRQDSGWTARWKGPEDSQLQGWYLRWQPGRNAAHLANMHDPRICLGGLGLEMQAELGTWQFQMGNLVLPVETFRFRDGASVVHVYYVLLDDKPASRMGRLYNNSVMSRLEAAMEGVKQRGQRLVEIGLWGDYPESKARAVVEQFLRTHTIVEAQG
jgi:hypothetical protein